jgi:VanZ family protein
MRSDDYTGRVILVYWLPALLWAALVLLASSDFFSSRNSGDWIGEIIMRVIGHPLPTRQFNIIHFLIRKSAHVTEYFILGALLFRAARGDRGGWRGRWALTALALAAGVATIDEWHQLFVPSRTGTALDVLLDGAGAAAAQLVARFRGYRVSR